jgi:sirohydrochlorin cobaltochelatase
MNTHGLLLVAHGSKDPEWTIPFKAIEDSAKREFSGPVVLSYLESSSPRIEQGLLQLLSSGVTNITVAPLFFGVGSHVKTDIPQIIQKTVGGHPGVAFNILPAVGQIPAIQRLISSEIVSQVSAEVIPNLQQVSEEISIAAQIRVEHIQSAANLGFRSIICNRPDEEEGEHQTPHQEIAQACARHGLKFTYFPVSPADHTEQQVRDMRDAVNQSPKPVLIYCRSGRRSNALLARSEELFDLYHPESFS